MPISPEEYWSESPERRSQRLYVAFCEFASAVLDFAEGTEIIEQRDNTGLRLNWAATILYYSLVHSSRFLIFVPIGDFPTAHAALAKCFDPVAEEIANTDWLRGFSAAGLRADRGAYSEAVHFDRLLSFWAEHVELTRAAGLLSWLGQALAAAKGLRNENNYEALLIAHEYRHQHLTRVFHDLAIAMAATARRALTEVSAFWSAALRDAPERDFVSFYVKGRILRPVESWYSYGVQAIVHSITQPFQRPEVNLDVVGKIESDVDWEVFNPKRSLMSQFEKKVEALTHQSEAPMHRVMGVPERVPIRCPTAPRPPRPASVPKMIRSTPEERVRLREDRKVRIAEMDGMDPIARLKIIAEDANHPIDFYPAQFGDVSDEILRSLPGPILARLRDKAAPGRKGEWKMFARRLMGL